MYISDEFMVIIWWLQLCILERNIYIGLLIKRKKVKKNNYYLYAAVLWEPQRIVVFWIKKNQTICSIVSQHIMYFCKTAAFKRSHLLLLLLLEVKTATYSGQKTAAFKVFPLVKFNQINENLRWLSKIGYINEYSSCRTQPFNQIKKTLIFND